MREGATDGSTTSVNPSAPYSAQSSAATPRRPPDFPRHGNDAGSMLWRPALRIADAHSTCVAEPSLDCPTAACSPVLTGTGSSVRPRTPSRAAFLNTTGLADLRRGAADGDYNAVRSLTNLFRLRAFCRFPARLSSRTQFERWHRAAAQISPRPGNQIFRRETDFRVHSTAPGISGEPFVYTGTPTAVRVFTGLDLTHSCRRDHTYRLRASSRHQT